MFSRQAAALFDYVFTDSMTWTDNRGRRMRLEDGPAILQAGTSPKGRDFAAQYADAILKQNSNNCRRRFAQF